MRFENSGWILILWFDNRNTTISCCVLQFVGRYNTVNLFTETLVSHVVFCELWVGGLSDACRSVP